MLLKLIFWIVVGYLAYKFIAELLMPASNAAVQMKDKIRQMQNMQEQMNKQQQQQQSSQTQQQQPSPSKDDYIDFEEIK
jgi:hemolysin activation/secretion protein